MSNVSIIITTHNRAAHLKDTLAALRVLQVPAGLNAEVLVVDNASTDATSRVVQEAICPPDLPIRYLYEARKGQSNARNTGIAATRSESILFTDDDVRPTPGWIAGMVEPLHKRKAMAVAGGVTLAPHLQRPWMTKVHRGCIAETSRLDPKNPGEMVGANMAFQREVLLRVPGFDPELGPGARGFADDTLFAMQLEKAGYRIWPALDVTVEHHFDESRLRRESWLAFAKKAGESWGYVMHHWEHAPVPQRKVLIKRPLRLAYSRLLLGNHWQHDEGMPEWELLLRIDIERSRSHFAERRSPRRYDKQGLSLLANQPRK